MRYNLLLPIILSSILGHSANLISDNQSSSKTLFKTLIYGMTTKENSRY